MVHLTVNAWIILARSTLDELHFWRTRACDGDIADINVDFCGESAESILRGQVTSRKITCPQCQALYDSALEIGG
jgi:hypothetical protein